MLKQKLKSDLENAIKQLGFEVDDIVLETSHNPQFGDYSSNISLQLANQKRGEGQQSPREIANELAKSMQELDYLASVEVAGPGFLNFKLKPAHLSQELNQILSKDNSYGSTELGAGRPVQIEFISANPTGPLTLANGRGGAIGDTLANLFEASGYQVNREYYVNDTGNQIRTLGLSVQAAAGKIEAEDTHYQGEYIKDLALKFANQLDQDPQTLGHELANYMLDQEIKPAIKKLNINFDNYFSEHSLYQESIPLTVQSLAQKDLTYEKDGAIWFKSTEFGDDKDRVLMTSEGSRGRQEPTYFLADIAHHIVSHDQGYLKRINVLGADHHSYATRISAVLKGLGYQDWKGGAWQDIIIMQLVRLFKGGQEVRMSKRAGNFVTIDELLDEVSADAVRYFFLMSSANTTVDFNLDLAKEQSNKNPVYYVQYAHARSFNILAKAEAKIDPAGEYQLSHPAELSLLIQLTALPDVIEDTVKDYQVNRLTNYAYQLADKLHKFYEQCPVLQAEAEEIKQARLALVSASQIVLANTLRLMGISAPERM